MDSLLTFAQASGYAEAEEVREPMAKKTKTKKGKEPLGLGRCVAKLDGEPRCPFPVFIAKHKLCSGHYKRLVRLGVVGGLLRPRRDLRVEGQTVVEAMA
jgi:hypothetical protein